MHSKWQAWDFFKTHPGVIQKEQGLYAYNSFDPFINSIIKDSINTEMIDGGLRTLMASDITTQWIEDNFLSLSLFGNADSFLIQNAHQLNKDCQELLLDPSLMLDNRYLILAFNEENAFFKKLTKEESVISYKIQEPAFWDNNKLLSFLADTLKVRLSHQAKQIILDRVTNSCRDFVNILNSLHINYGQNEVSPQMLGQLMVPSKIDKFELAELFSSRKQDAFFRKIMTTDTDDDTLRDLFYFMQGHLMKIYDTGYTNKKKKLSQYDKKVMGHAKTWKPQELEEQIEVFRRLEQSCKLKRPSFNHELKQAYLRYLTT
jgi:hypothetical protein